MPEIPKDEIHKHIVVTEAVHCKSKSEYGVKECACLCVRKWLDKVLSEYNGKYIVVVVAPQKPVCLHAKYKAKKLRLFLLLMLADIRTNSVEKYF